MLRVSAFAVNDQHTPTKTGGGGDVFTQPLQATLDGIAVEVERVLDVNLAGAKLGDLRVRDTRCTRRVAATIAFDRQLHRGR